MKKQSYILIMALTIIFSALAGGYIFAMQNESLNPSSSEIDEQEQSIDYSCNEDKDCVVKDIGSCCGYNPSCVNENANPNPDLAMKMCEEKGLAGVCGFPSIESCKCVNNQCQPEGHNQQE